MLLKPLVIAIRNMQRQPRRSVLTALSFAVAVFLYTVLIAVPVSMDRIAADAAKEIALIRNSALFVQLAGQILRVHT